MAEQTKYKFEGYVKELKWQGANQGANQETNQGNNQGADQGTNKFCKFKVDTVYTVAGKEFKIVLKDDKDIVAICFDELNVDNDIFQFISQHSKEKLLVEIDDKKSKIVSVALIYG